MGVASNKFALLALAAIGIILFAELYGMISKTLTFLYLLVVGVESAQCVARNSFELYTQRLSFWVLVMVWQWLTAVPVVGMLIGVATPIVLVATFVAGETLFVTFFSLAHPAVLRLAEKGRAKAAGAGQKEPLLPVLTDASTADDAPCDQG